MLRFATRLSLRALFVVCASAHSLGAQTPSPEIDALVDRFMALDRARQAPGATPLDVDRLLALLSDSVVYEHPRAGARLHGKDVLRRGMLSYLGTVRHARDSIIQRTTLPGVVVIVSETQAEMLRDSTWVPLRRRSLRVFELEGDRVRRIIDYGW